MRSHSLTRLAGALTIAAASAVAAAPALAAPGATGHAVSATHSQGPSRAALATAQAATEDVGDRLTAGQSLSPSQYLSSASGQHELAADGAVSQDVGLYLSGWSGSWHVFNENMAGLDQTQNLFVMQEDGNAVLYNAGTPVWASNTAGNAGAMLVVQDDGNVVVYSASGTPLYASGSIQSVMFGYNVDGSTWSSYLEQGWSISSPNGRYRLIMQSDGNLVLYSPTRAIWNSGTVGNPGAFLALQSDCNMVVYADGGAGARWSTGTSRSGEWCELTMQNDGNLVMYHWADVTSTRVTVPWTTRTAGVS
ncbi:MAG: hypothetical protein ACK5MT_00690 [Actinomycetales bacterium]